MSIQERIQVILKMHNLSPSSFADQIGVQRSNVSHVLSGRNKPGLDFLEKILIHFPRVNAHWLITGKLTDQETVNSEELNSSIGKKPLISPPEPSSKEFEIDNIVVFYKDGSFVSYKPKQ